MRMILLLLLFGNCFCLDLGIKNVEEFNYKEYIGNGQTTYDQKDRIRESLKLLDAKMDEVIISCNSKLDDAAKKLLSESQTKWKDYALASSAFISDQYRGGTLQGINHGSALAEMTRIRIVDLLSYEKIYFSP